ncbi:MAG: MATE family efflux transporter [Bacteroidales bacterium]|nr:MATE family efflux transporter [Bacteroidales bacterium]
MKFVQGLNREILRLAIPSTFANITVPLVGIVDTAIVGHVADVSALGGIAIGTMLFDLLYWNFGFLRIGTGGMTAQAFGRNDRKETAHILMQSSTIAVGAALLIWALQWLFVNIVLSLVPCSPGVDAFAREYFFVRVWAAPATLLLLTLKGWFIGMQNTVLPMVCDLVVNGVNIVASYVLAVYTPMGAIGVAYGTVIAQYTGLAVAAVLLLIRYRYLFPLINFKECMRWKQMRRLFVLNSNIFVRSLCFMVIYVGFTSLATLYGDNELAISSIMMKLFLLYSYFLDGFAYAGEALVGRFFGERDERQVVQTVKILFVWTVVIDVVSIAVYAAFGNDMLRLMTSQEELIAAAQPYMIWLILMPLISCFAFIWDGIYVGATAGKDIRNCMIVAAIGFVAGYLCLAGSLGMQAVYVAYFIHLIIRTIYLTFRWKYIRQTI